MSIRGRFPKRNIPIDYSLEGLLQALLAEQRELSPIDLQAVEWQNEKGSDLYSVRFDADSAKLLSTRQEGYNIAGRRRKDGSYPWMGLVHVVSPEHATIVFEYQRGDTAPQTDSVCQLHEPDFQKRMRLWLSERIEKEGAAIPESAYLEKLYQATDAPMSDGVVEADPALRDAQRLAVLRSGRRFSVVWGPPGTGKTYTVGAIVAAHVAQGERVLVATQTNSAADQAALAIDDALCRRGYVGRTGSVVRPGRPVTPELEQREHLLAWTLTLEKFAGEIRELTSRIQQKKRLLGSVEKKERDSLIVRLAELKRSRERERVKRAKALWDLSTRADVIIGTLFSCFCRDDVLKPFFKEDSGERMLVFDEASAIARYAVLPFLQYRPDRLVVAGDARQLGPARRNPSQTDFNSIYWIGSDLFQTVKCSKDAEIAKIEQSDRLTMLDLQSRMTDDLCRPVSRKFYEGRLNTIDPPPGPPVVSGWPASSRIVVDPVAAPLPPRSPSKVSGKVWKLSCERSAWISIGLAEWILSTDHRATIMISTPFSRQANLLSTLVRAELSRYSERVTCGTVNVLQGQQADVVVFNVVDALNTWLQGGHGTDSRDRLLCVAFSRARRQIVLISDPDRLKRNYSLKPLVGDAIVWQPDWSKSDLRQNQAR